MTGDASNSTEQPVISDMPVRASRTLSPSAIAEHQSRRQRQVMLVIRMLFLVLVVTVSLLPFVGQIEDAGYEFTVWDYIIASLATFAFGVVIVLIDIAVPNKRLASVFGIYLGIIAGLIGALGIGALLDLIASSWDLTISKTGLAYLSLVKLVIGITVCYLAVSIVLTTKDDFRLVIPYVEFAKQVRGVRPLLLDTSVLIDGRIEGLCQSGFLDAPLVVPQFVLEELQALADSSDKLKRARGRRGLNVVSKLQGNPAVDVSIDNATVAPGPVDRMLLQMAGDQNLRILTTDYNLNKVGQIHGVTVLNLNELANAVKSQAIPGETLQVEIVKHGEGANQGVGYLPDGTMVVVEEAGNRIGQSVQLVVTNSLQTSAGRMIFGTVRDGQGESNNAIEHLAHAATHQPRTPIRAGARVEEADSPRNPRR